MRLRQRVERLENRYDDFDRYTIQSLGQANQALEKRITELMAQQAALLQHLNLEIQKEPARLVVVPKAP